MLNLRLYPNQIDPIIKNALQEDMPLWDLTTDAIYRSDELCEVDLLSKAEGIIAGLDVFRRTFELLDPSVEFDVFKSDGDPIEPGDKILTVRGNARTLLSGERVAINFCQRLSGIATYTNETVRALNDASIKVVDTRKTTPGLRVMEKYAVRVGGGFNHRFNLSDGVLIKDNHIGAAGSVTEAIERVRATLAHVQKIEIEVETLEQVQEALEAKADMLLLDNMDVPTLKEAIKLVAGRAVTEISGNVTQENIAQYRGIGADIISSGSITYAASPLDLSMKNLRYL